MPERSTLDRLEGVSVFATRGGRCHTCREYFDRGAALLAVGIAPEAVARIVRRRPTVEVVAVDVVAGVAEDPGS